MTRMSRNWIGGAGDPPTTSKTFMVVCIIFIVYCVLWIILYSVMVATMPKCEYYRYSSYRCTGPGTYNAMSALLSIMNIVFSVYFLVAMCQTRKTIREKYNIPPSSCGDCDDCCCTFWCSCCSINQMARHTNDYNAYPVECCSGDCFNKTGQPAGAPVIVV